jgi:hypothetical protein
MKIKKLVAGSVVAASALGLAAGNVGAAPNKETVALTCGSDSYEVVVNGNGQFTPGLVVGSTRVAVPIAFGEGHFTITDLDGNVVFEDTEPASTKGQSAKSVKNPVECTFEQSFVSDGSDPEIPEGYTATFSGSVTVGFTPRKP